MTTRFSNHYKCILLRVGAGVFLFLLAWPAYAQSTRNEIYQSFVSGDMARWKSVLVEQEARGYVSHRHDLELVGYYYGYIGYCLGVKNKPEAQVYVGRGEAILNKLAKSQSDVDMADVYAYKAAFVGFKIALSPLKAPFIGKSSTDNVRKALEINVGNVQANIEQANIFHYAPAAFGGNQVAAKRYYQNAIALFDSNPSLKHDSWLYLSVLTSVGKMYDSDKNYALARQLFEKILSIEPNYRYVRDQLLPDLLARM